MGFIADSSGWEGQTSVCVCTIQFETSVNNDRCVCMIQFSCGARIQGARGGSYLPSETSYFVGIRVWAVSISAVFSFSFIVVYIAVL